MRQSALLRCSSLRTFTTIANGRTTLMHVSNVRYSSILHNIQRVSKRGPLIFHLTSQDPYQNLAVEYYLLTRSDPLSHILLFYTNRPCVVIGRNQNPWLECNLSLLERGLDGMQIELVRRRSGGGTVFHDAGNLNFSVIVPNDKEFTRRKHAEMVVRALRTTESTLEQYRYFENVEVNERHDIVMSREGKTFKVSGSAFKLTRGRALHHGTILHSSPNLQNISTYLRSAGKQFITAKGVESVRSPVSNLFKIREEQRGLVRGTIADAIEREFRKLYGKSEQKAKLDVADAYLEEIEKGMNEIRSVEWRFGQTPHFEFTNLEGNGKKTNFAANRGTIIESSIKSLEGVSLLDRLDWSVVGNPQLARVLGETFPSIPA